MIPSTEKDVGQAKVTAIVLNWCGEAVSRECLNSLESSDYQPLSILLVDNGSPDQSGERLNDAFPNVDYLQTGSNLGYTGGNNRGIQWALEREADFILILNNDTVLEAETVSRLVGAARGGEGRVGGVVPKILYYHDPSQIWFGGGAFDRLKGLGVHWREGESDNPEALEEPRDVTFMTGACCLLSATALKEVNGFDEEYFAYVEDAELSLRMAEAGCRIVYEPQARVLHHVPPPGTPPTPFQIRQRDRNRRRVMRTHFPLGKRLPFLVRFYLTRGILLLRYLLSGDRDRARAILDGMGEV